MIDKKDYEKLLKRWKGKFYQSWGRISYRMPVFLKYVNQFKGKNVLELGCNAGLYGYEISKVAKSYVGVEMDERYVHQALETKKHFNMNNSEFYNYTVGEYLERCDVPKFDALFATFVLYYMTDKEMDLLEHVLSNCDVAVIITRTHRNVPWVKYNKYHLEKPKNCAKWLQRAGFKTKIKKYNKPNGKYYYAVICGNRS